MKVWIVYTEDTEHYVFSTEQKAKKFASEAIATYAEDTGQEIYEAHDFAWVEEANVDES